MARQQWTLHQSSRTFTRPDGWSLERVRPEGGGWYLSRPDAPDVVHFHTDGGAYLAIDMANEYITAVAAQAAGSDRNGVPDD